MSFSCLLRTLRCGRGPCQRRCDAPSFGVLSSPFVHNRFTASHRTVLPPAFARKGKQKGRRLPSEQGQGSTRSDDSQVLLLLNQIITDNSQLRRGIESQAHELANVCSEVGSLRGEVGSLRGEVGSLRDEVGSLRGEVGSLRGEVGSLRGEVGSLRGEVGSLRGEVGSLRDEVGSLRGEVDRVSSQVGSLSSQVGRMSQIQGRITEVIVTQLLPPPFQCGAQLFLGSDFDLDRAFGAGTAAAVLSLCCGPASREVLRALVGTISRELDNKKLDASEARKLQATARTFLEQQEPDVASVRKFVGAAKKLLEDARVLGEGGSSRWNSAFRLLRRLEGHHTPAGHDSPSDDSSSREALLVLFLLATGRLQDVLEIDVFHLDKENHTALSIEIKSHMAEIAGAKEQLGTGLPVVELAYRLAPQRPEEGSSTPAAYSTSTEGSPQLGGQQPNRPPLDMRAVVCSLSDGVALAACQQEVKKQLRVKLASSDVLPPTGGPDIVEIPVECYYVGSENKLKNGQW